MNAENLVNVKLNTTHPCTTDSPSIGTHILTYFQSLLNIKIQSINPQNINSAAKYKLVFKYERSVCASERTCDFI